MERPGLLIPPRPDDTANNLRRPADIYLPAWYDGLPAALDFAVTAPQRLGIVATAAREALAAATAYSQQKRDHANTEADCTAAGVTFLPMVAETTGAWAPEALLVLKQLAKAAAIKLGRDAAVVTKELLQGTAVTIRRANARAHLRRFGAVPVVGTAPALIELSADD